MVLIESLQYIVIPILDIGKSLGFYNGLLDFDIIEEKNEKGALVQFGEVNFQLLKVEEHTPAKQPLLSCSLDVDDFTQALQDFDAEQVEVVDGPSEIPGGERVLIADPSGNLLEFFYIEA